MLGLYRAAAEADGKITEDEQKRIDTLGVAIIKAESLLALERELNGEKDKVAEKQWKNFDKRIQAMSQENKLAKIQLQYGRDSLEFMIERRGQALSALDDELNALVKSNELTQEQSIQIMQTGETLHDNNLKIWKQERALRASEAAARDLARALQAASTFSLGIDGEIAVIDAQIEALANGADVSIAKTIAAKKQQAKEARDAVIEASKGDVTQIFQADMTYAIDMAAIDELEVKLGKLSARQKAIKGGSKIFDQMAKDAERLNDAALGPLAAYNKELAKLDTLKKSHGLTNAGYDKALKDLNLTLADQIPMVSDVSSAWGDFIAGGMKDMDSFESAITSSFKRMVADMIAENMKLQAMSLFTGIGGGGSGGLFGGKIIPGILHDGGVAGSDGYGHGRAFPASTWANAPRYHDGGIAGLRPNEVPAILERGEAVIPERMMRKASARGSVSQEQATQVTVNQTFHIGAGANALTRQEFLQTAPMARDSAIEGVEEARRRGALI